jgi:hypothetical protein
MGKLVDRAKYLRDCAGTMRGQLGIDPAAFKGMKLADIEAALRKTKTYEIQERLDKAPDEQVGKLACSWSDSETIQLAIRALIPAIALKVWAAANPDKVIKCRFCDWTTAKFARIGAKGFERLREHLDEAHRDRAEEIAKSVYGGMGERDDALVDEYGPIPQFHDE